MPPRLRPTRLEYVVDGVRLRAQLSAAGYSGVHDVKLDDGLWKAKGTTAAGEKVKVRLDPTTGEVIALEKD